MEGAGGSPLANQAAKKNTPPSNLGKKAINLKLVNSGPVCKETEFEMIERMLNIVLPFGMNDDTEEEDDEQEKELRNNNKWVKVEM